MKWVFVAWIFFTFAVILLLAFHGQAEDKPAAKPAPVSAPAATENKILKAQRAVQDAQAELAQLSARWQSTQLQAKDLEAQAPAAQKKVSTAQEALEKEIVATAKELGLDYPAKYDFNRASLEFNPKALPAPATPSPDKK